MAIKKFSDIPMSQLEKTVSTPVISPTSTSSGNNDEYLGDNPGINTPYTDESLDDELYVLQSLSENQLNLDNNKAMRYLAGTKTSVVYFNQVQPRINNDIINVANMSSTNSTKFNRIDNMIINTDSELNSAFDIDDEGVAKNEITASGIVFPGFQPYPGDLFYANVHNNSGVLYKVISIEPITQLSQSGFKIEYTRHYEQFSPDQMTNLIEGYYVFNFEAVGTGQRVVLERKLYDIYKTIKTAYAIISNEYLHRFYDRNKNVIRWKKISPLNIPNFNNLNSDDIFTDEMEIPKVIEEILDPYIMRFLQDQNLKNTLKYKGYSIYPIIPFDMGEDFEEQYKYSIYYAFLHRKPKLVKYRYSHKQIFKSRTLRELSYDNWLIVNLRVKNTESSLFHMYPENFISKLIANDLYTEEFNDVELLKYNTIIKFMHDKKYVPSEDEIQVFIREIELIPDEELFGTGPILLYMCAFYIDLIMRKSR